MSVAPGSPYPWMEFPDDEPPADEPEWCGHCDRDELCVACGDRTLAPASRVGYVER